MHPEANTRLIPLSRGLWTLVDAEDWPALSRFKWSVSKAGTKLYAVRSSKRPRKRTFSMHREIMDFQPGDPEIDHINGDGLDNRRSNLRPATHTQNMRNRAVRGRNNASGFKGVSFHIGGNRWQAFVGKRYLGLFNTPEEAARAYDAAALRLHGDFAQLNFPHQAATGAEAPVA